MNIQRTNIVIFPDYKRVLIRPFTPVNKSQSIRIAQQIIDLSEQQAEDELNQILGDFEDRHRNLKDFYLKRFEQNSNYLNTDKDISPTKKHLFGAYFSMEYSVESAALFNPSVVWHPDQSNLPKGARRFIMSLRATGEGHVSSIEFRTGYVDNNLQIHMDQPNRFVTRPTSFSSLNEAEYKIQYDESTDLAERIIFPAYPAEQNGIEDARFVLFTDEKGVQKYYATYTAYDGRSISSQLLETSDFMTFNVRQLTGAEIQNKGMALFPRKINGLYVMLSRQDNENNYIMFSNDLYNWDSKHLLLKPEYSWEFIQIGNCGSPIETNEGWLVLTHGVGAMRKYSFSALLLDKDNPEKVIGTLKEPLVSPSNEERDGYVPNVVYSCGGIEYNSHLILPYAMADFASTFGLVNMDKLLNELIS
ncbi:glycosidase [candidate division KSB1 bacterium]|nr:glycoside hydrolase family 130 protein [candidate division KSB1 bacterium]RQW01637.1 MAG: glycosidase [candidate division KSB1 bacterium]